jgi:hypothetical protein
MIKIFQKLKYNVFAVDITTPYYNRFEIKGNTITNISGGSQILIN